MSDHIHFLITGERGKTIKLHLKRQKVFAGAMISAALLVTLSIASFYSLSFFSHNQIVTSEIADLTAKAESDRTLIADLQAQVEAQRDRFEQQISALVTQNEQKIAALTKNNEHALQAQLMSAHDERNMLKAEISRLKQKNNQLTAHFKQEKDQLLSTAVHDLHERSELIENVMRNIGVKVSSSSTSKEGTGNSGGPFIALEPGTSGDLLKQTDKYIKAIKAIPLGRPVNTKITSYFGPRKDPLNKKRGFHEGIDFSGRRGDKIYATADGTVRTAKRHRSYGNYVEINHSNGYRTTFAHMKKYVVKVGDKVKRGQLIGHIGSTGRSTGPHLHYEVHYQGKPVDPMKFMQVTKLLKKKITLTESAKKKYGNVQ